MDESVNPQPNRKVLIIEDEYFISELYVRALEKAGYEVVLAIDGKDGYDKALSDAFDIILLDIMVPTMTGTEILERLRERSPAIKAKIIIITNLEQGEENKQKIEQQADGYIIKAEITPKQLVGFLNNIK
jgi:DNA-binding response OmpR family regulator